jgi:hypothetical protein
MLWLARTLPMSNNGRKAGPFVAGLDAGFVQGRFLDVSGDT